MKNVPILFRDLGKVSSRERTPEGFLSVIADFARTGVQEYYAGELPHDQLPPQYRSDPYAVLRLLRPEAEVFDEASMKSFAHKPVTAGHPPQFVDAKNYRDYQIGFSKGSVEKRENRLRVGLTLQDAETIQQVNDGRDQLSAGYQSEVVWQPGVHPEYGPYDAVQTKIRGNHIAVVDKARGGSELRINDSWPTATTQQGGEPMPESTVKREINGIAVEFSDQGAQAVDHLVKRLGDLDKSMADLKTQLTDAKKDRDKLQGELDAERSNQITDEQIEQRVTERLELIDMARELCKDLDVKGKSLTEIKVAAINHVDSSFDLKGKSDEYVTAVFDTLYARREDPATTSTRQAFAGMPANYNDDIAGEARKRFAERSANAWKGGQA